MKKFDIRNIFIGFLVGTVGVSTVFAANGIRTANLSNATVSLNGVPVPLDNSLVSIVKDNEENASLYMPVRELLEYMGYDVNRNNNNINITNSEINSGVGITTRLLNL